MNKIFQIEISGLDLGQAIDGLEVRAKAWENTARYLRTGKVPEKLFIAEECSGPDEASRLAKHYRSIIRKIRKQMAEQR